MNDYRGACHCGSIQVSLQSTNGPGALGARDCDCSFCRLHGASWTSDPNGQLEISTSADVHRYQFGSKSSDFLICRECGVVPAVVGEVAGRLFGVVNVNCMDAAAEMLKVRQILDFEEEQVEDRLARRARIWSPARVRISGL
jgi:hypothetical protein